MKYLLKIRTSGNRSSGDRTSGGPPVLAYSHMLVLQMEPTWSHNFLYLALTIQIYYVSLENEI